ncbi:cystatin domain-containing protein [uncultured Thiothrix sp.]|uniref:cystatin domain-containing protein n=1 Tax=uncultured Thiothrix sp. TaxID=223185 RepID=UPI002626D3B3|nr:cystatin domain-containing protein [uncultured Thiothrix sp.]HMT93872.1 cystatin domain-containing protein [Thiolinea sp.]
MKKLAACFVFVISCLLTACNTNPTSTTPQPSTPAPTQPQIVGGYSAVDLNDAEVQNAAQFAAQSLGGLLGKVTQAEQQVVAGMNYKLSLELQDGSKHKVVVYKDLQGNMSLTQK